MDLSDELHSAAGSDDRVSLTMRIEALAAKVEDLLSDSLETGLVVREGDYSADSSSADDKNSAFLSFVNGDREGPSSSGQERRSDARWGDQVSYLQSALSQRSVEAEDWMKADREARQLLSASRTALAKAEAALSKEREGRSLAEQNVLRLTEEIEILTRLLLEVEKREAQSVEAAKAEVLAVRSDAEDSARKLDEYSKQVAELEARISFLVEDAEDWSRSRGSVEAGLIEERARTDQYRDVAEKMQALCIYQNREMTLLRDRVGEAESRAETQLQDFNRLMKDYRKIRQTTSWKATAPIRKFFKMLRSLLKPQSQ